MSASIFLSSTGLNVLGSSANWITPGGLNADDDDFILENLIYRRNLWMTAYSDDNHIIALRIFA